MKKNNRVFKPIALTSKVIFLFLLGVLLVNCTSNAPSFDKALMQTASELNEVCPMMVDNITRLDNAVALPGKVFQYNYTLIYTPKDSINIEVFEDILKPTILSNAKTNPDLQNFRDNKVTMVYSYKDMFGGFITKITITPDQYQE